MEWVNEMNSSYSRMSLYLSPVAQRNLCLALNLVFKLDWWKYNSPILSVKFGEFWEVDTVV